MFRAKRGTATALSKVLPYIKVPLVANAHPLQVNSGIGFLRTLEGFSFVSGLAFPYNLLVGARSVLSIRARNGFDITADERNDFPVGHVPMFPSAYFARVGKGSPLGWLHGSAGETRMVGAGHRAPDLRAQCRCSAPTRAIPAGRVLVVRGYLTVRCLTPRSTLRLLEHCILRRSGVHYPSAGKSKRKSWVRPN